MPQWLVRLNVSSPSVPPQGDPTRLLSVVSKLPKLLPGSLSFVILGKLLSKEFCHVMYSSTLGTVHTSASGLGCSLNRTSRSSWLGNASNAWKGTLILIWGVTNVPPLFLPSGSVRPKSSYSVSESPRDPFVSNFCRSCWGSSASSGDLFDPPPGVTDEPPPSIDEFVLAVRGSEHCKYRSPPYSLIFPPCSSRGTFYFLLPTLSNLPTGVFHL